MILAIDPGAAGGIAWYDAGTVDAIQMPDGMTALCDWLRSERHHILRCHIEKVGMHRQGNAASSSATFARHCGHIEAACYLLGYPVVEVTPAKWMDAIKVPKFDPPKPKPMPKQGSPEHKAYRRACDEAKRKRKAWIRDAMQRRYPHLKVTLKTADALGILTYALETA
jgi:hypothetical protein